MLRLEFPNEDIVIELAVAVEIDRVPRSSDFRAIVQENGDVSCRVRVVGLAAHQ